MSVCNECYGDICGCTCEQDKVIAEQAEQITELEEKICQYDAETPVYERIMDDIKAENQQQAEQIEQLQGALSHYEVASKVTIDWEESKLGEIAKLKAENQQLAGSFKNLAEAFALVVKNYCPKTMQKKILQAAQPQKGE